MENLLKIKKLIKGKTTHSIIVDVDLIIDYFPFVTCDFDFSANSTIEFYIENSNEDGIEDGLEKFIVGVGFKVNTEDLYVVIKSKPIGITHPVHSEINYYGYPISTLNSEDIICLIKILKRKYITIN